MPLLNVWESVIAHLSPDLQVEYSPTDSETGIQQIIKGKIDFALTEVPLTTNQLSESSVRLEQFPVTAGPVCMVYHLPKLLFPLKLTPQTLAGIYLGEITRWNDAAIRRDNPNVTLPGTNILTVHRSDRSGTTGIFTQYLSAVSSEWKGQAGWGMTVNWPLVGRLGAGNQGVAAAVTHVDGGIGYVECAYARNNHLPVARIQNQSGNYVDPDAPSVAAALNSAAPMLAGNPFYEPVNSPDPAAYPIVGVSYIVFPRAVMKSRDLQPLLGFLDWALNRGQTLAPVVNFAPLPETLLKRQRQLLNRDPAVPLTTKLLFGEQPDQDRSVSLPEGPTPGNERIQTPGHVDPDRADKTG